MKSSVRARLLEAVPLLMLVAVVIGFAAASPAFLTLRNLTNIGVQAASIGIVAAGMTFVLIGAGIDLSVGSVMFLSAAVAGKLVLGLELPAALAFAAALATGFAFGAVNALFTARLRMLGFVVTMATLYIGRGAALYITQTRAMNLPDDILLIGTGTLLAVPVPVWVLAVVVAGSHAVLTRTAFGRSLYAVGHDQEAARRAGINVSSVLAGAYIICGFCAALGGLVAVAQLGAVSPTFGTGREFAAIAAAVLGGTSLFGGRGSVLPGTLIGALLIQTVESGLVMLNADPYLYPMATATVIFAAVLLDVVRQRQAEAAGQRRIRPLETAQAFRARVTHAGRAGK